MRVLMLHGLESTPGGTKADHLALKGCAVINPELPKESWDRSLEIAQEAFNREKPDVVVGSSRGGALAMHLDSGRARLVLIAPAWRRFGHESYVKQGTWILHSEHDDVVPLDHSRDLQRNSILPSESLVIVGQDHRMKDPAALEALWSAVNTPMPPRRGSPPPLTVAGVSAADITRTLADKKCPRCASPELLGDDHQQEGDPIAGATVYKRVVRCATCGWRASAIIWK